MSLTRNEQQATPGLPLPVWGEGGGEGVTSAKHYRKSCPPHPNPLPAGEREPTASAPPPRSNLRGPHTSRDEKAMLTAMAAKLLAAFILLITMGDLARAQIVPLPRSRPDASAPSLQAPAPAEAEPPSACRLRLTDALAVAPSIPAIEGPGECGGSDLVRLEAVLLANKSRIAVTPPALLRCTLAEAIVQWVREDSAAAARALNGTLAGIDNYSSYDCRGRNRIVGARLSEHGKANALDLRSIRLAGGAVIELTDPQVEKTVRENVRARTCARFSTVLGPGLRRLSREPHPRRSGGTRERVSHLPLGCARAGARGRGSGSRSEQRRHGDRRAAAAASAPPHPRVINSLQE